MALTRDVRETLRASSSGGSLGDMSPLAGTVKAEIIDLDDMKTNQIWLPSPAHRRRRVGLATLQRAGKCFCFGCLCERCRADGTSATDTIRHKPF